MAFSYARLLILLLATASMLGVGMANRNFTKDLDTWNSGFNHTGWPNWNARSNYTGWSNWDSSSNHSSWPNWNSTSDHTNHSGFPIWNSGSNYSGWPNWNSSSDHTGWSNWNFTYNHSGFPIWNSGSNYSGWPNWNSSSDHTGWSNWNSTSNHSGFPIWNSGSNYSGWPFGHENATHESRKIVVGGSENWHFGFNYSDWAMKNGPFFYNDTLVFKYDPPSANNTHPHSVYLLPNLRSFLGCDLRRAKRVARTTQGGGAGFRFVLNKWRPHYFACGESNGFHCRSGMKFIVMPMHR